MNDSNYYSSPIGTGTYSYQYEKRHHEICTSNEADIKKYDIKSSYLRDPVCNKIEECSYVITMPSFERLFISRILISPILEGRLLISTPGKESIKCRLMSENLLHYAYVVLCTPITVPDKTMVKFTLEIDTTISIILPDLILLTAQELAV